jgi:hypothetical protein
VSSCTCDFGSGLKVCHCAACHRTFTGVRGFDMHRTGPIEARSCRDPATMTRQDGRPLYVPVRGRWAVNARDKGAAPNWSENPMPASAGAR